MDKKIKKDLRKAKIVMTPVKLTAKVLFGKEGGTVLRESIVNRKDLTEYQKSIMIMSVDEGRNRRG